MRESTAKVNGYHLLRSKHGGDPQPLRHSYPRNDVLHSLAVVRVSECSLDPTATRIEVTEANFQGEKEVFCSI